MAAVAAAAAATAAAATTTTTEAATTTAATTTTARAELYQSPAALETAGTVDAPKALTTATSTAAATSPPTAATTTAFATTRLHLTHSPFIREETVERSLDAISRGGRQKRTRFGVELRLPI